MSIRSMRRSARRSQKRRGFTLLEVMLVLVIIAAIAGIAVYNIGGIKDTANKMTASNQIDQVRTVWRKDTGSHPIFVCA